MGVRSYPLNVCLRITFKWTLRHASQDDFVPLWPPPEGTRSTLCFDLRFSAALEIDLSQGRRRLNHPKPTSPLTRECARVCTHHPSQQHAAKHAQRCHAHVELGASESSRPAAGSSTVAACSLSAVCLCSFFFFL